MQSESHLVDDLPRVDDAPKLLFLATEDSFFWSYALSAARAAKQEGYDVMIASELTSYADDICNEGFRLVHIDLGRSRSLWGRVQMLRRLRSFYKSEQPDAVNTIAVECMLYSELAAFGLNVRTIHSITGLGYLVASRSLKARILKTLVWTASRFVVNPVSTVLVENSDDKWFIADRLKVPPDNILVSKGAGVDTTLFPLLSDPDGPLTVTLIARMIRIKGIEEFAEAASILKTRGLNARFVLVGDPDPKNPSSLKVETLEGWNSSDVLEWWGYQSNLLDIFRQSHLVCLPSHGGEGIPRVLMQAASCGRAIVTTDVPGCRDIVRQNENGILVSPMNAVELADAIQLLLENPATRLRMAKRGRELAIAEFRQEDVVRKMVDLYTSVTNAHQSV